MKAINFPEKNQDIGKDQEQYLTLPSKIIVNRQVPIWNKWKPSKEDLKVLNEGGHIWLCQITGGAPYHPIKLTTETPDFKQLDADAERETEALIKKINAEHKKGDVDLTSEQAIQLRDRMRGFKKGRKK